jgi:hypothetical protein
MPQDRRDRRRRNDPTPGSPRTRLEDQERRWLGRKEDAGEATALSEAAGQSGYGAGRDDAAQAYGTTPPADPQPERDLDAEAKGYGGYARDGHRPVSGYGDRRKSRRP